MADKQPPQKLDTFLLLRRYLCGITIVCVIVTVIASMRINASVEAITWRASQVGLSILAIQWLIIRTFRAWSLAQTRTNDNRRRK